MNTLSARISRRLKMIIHNFQSDSHFSFYYALLRIADEVGGRLHLTGLSNKAHKQKDQWILNYLRSQQAEVLAEYRGVYNVGTAEPDAPIWICWWTGVDTAPPLVKQCIRSTLAHAGEHPVHIIDKNNYHQFVSVPDYMLQKVQNGNMGLAHLADYIRVSLLAEHGGLWLDATIFCANLIPQKYFEYPIFTCKSDPQPSRYLSQMRWTTFVLGGWKGNVFYRYLKSAFETYWQNAEVAIDYLFFDYLIELGCQELQAVKQQLEQLPVNNLHRDELQAAMNRAAPAVEWEHIIHPDTALYKLSWRETYSDKAVDGTHSIYTRFLNMSI